MGIPFPIFLLFELKKANPAGKLHQSRQSGTILFALDRSYSDPDDVVRFLVSKQPGKEHSTVHSVECSCLCSPRPKQVER
jgi:hypothetical protein